MNPWIHALQRKEKRMIARIMSHIENEEQHTEAMLEAIYPYTGKAFVVGVTGPPGVGKSSFIDGLISHLRSLHQTVGVIAIDPTSPFTGGAILGDRVRMVNHSLDPGVFIRSMGSRGKQGGIAYCTREMIHVLDAAAFDVILVETVGVGQAELDIMHFADSVVLLLHPESGDRVQVAKAGVMEIGDLFVVNKADLKGSARLISQIQDMMQWVEQEGAWSPPVMGVIAKDNVGIAAVWEGLIRHQVFQRKTGGWTERRQRHLRYAVCQIVDRLLGEKLDALLTRKECREDEHEMLVRKTTPYQVAKKWLDQV